MRGSCFSLRRMFFVYACLRKDYAVRLLRWLIGWRHILPRPHSLYKHMELVDLRDPFYSVPIHKEDKTLLRFCWGGTWFQFISLPNDQACAPRRFTALPKPEYAILLQKGPFIIGYTPINKGRASKTLKLILIILVTCSQSWHLSNFLWSQTWSQFNYLCFWVLCQTQLICLLDTEENLAL